MVPVPAWAFVPVAAPPVGRSPEGRRPATRRDARGRRAWQSVPHRERDEDREGARDAPEDARPEPPWNVVVHDSWHPMIWIVYALVGRPPAHEREEGGVGDVGGPHQGPGGGAKLPRGAGGALRGATQGEGPHVRHGASRVTATRTAGRTPSRPALSANLVATPLDTALGLRRGVECDRSPRSPADGGSPTILVIGSSFRAYELRHTPGQPG